VTGQPVICPLAAELSLPARCSSDLLLAWAASDRPVKPPTWPRPVNKALRASLDGKTAAVARLAARAGEDDGPGITQRVALTDGADAVQRAMLTLLPASTLVLDLIHAVASLWAAANGLLASATPTAPPGYARAWSGS
jgi:hypothetical protein